MAISVSEAILRRQGGGPLLDDVVPSYASLQASQSPVNTVPQTEEQSSILSGPFSNIAKTATQNIGNFFTSPKFGSVPNTLGKIGDVVSFLTPAGFALSGIAGLSEFNALNEALSKYGVPEDQQLGVKDALIAMLPGPTLQGQFQNALSRYNEGIMDNVRDDMFNAAFGDYYTAGSPGDPAQGSGIFSAGFPGDPAQGSGSLGNSDDGGSSTGSSGGGMSDGVGADPI